MILHPPAVQLGKLGGHFENANNLKGAHNKTCHTNSVEQEEGYQPQDTIRNSWFAKVKENAETTQTEAA